MLFLGYNNPMPFKSKSQAKYLFAKHPDVAKEFADKTPDIKRLPEHVSAAKPHPIPHPDVESPAEDASETQKDEMREKFVPGRRKK
jgi:hypothetical protein